MIQFFQKTTLAVSFLILLGACHTVKTKPTMGDNSQNSVDWAGIYTGTLPCTDCEGLSTFIKLNKDLTYKLITQHKGKSDKKIEKTGTFKWNDQGSGIVLNGIKYQVGENQITQLDSKGNKMVGNFQLSKLNKDVSNKTWKIIELNGKAINEDAQKYFIQIDADKKQFGAKAGCNSIGGSVEIKGDFNISFSKIFSTMMACPDMTNEMAFTSILEKVDNYTTDGEYLSLNKARMAPLARFEWVYFDK